MSDLLKPSPPASSSNPELSRAFDSVRLSHPESSPGPQASFSIDALRIDQDYLSEDVGVVQQTISVAKPTQFKTLFRAHPKWKILAYTLEYEQEVYVVESRIAKDLEGDLKLRELVPCITRAGDVFVWPVGVPKPLAKTDSWTRSARIALSDARTGWIRLRSNQSIGSYQVVKPQSATQWPEPVWPYEDANQIFELALASLVINAVDHPVLQTLRGEL